MKDILFRNLRRDKVGQTKKNEERKMEDKKKEQGKEGGMKHYRNARSC